MTEIARQLGRHRSTIYRELRRNTFHDAEFPEYSGHYSGIATTSARSVVDACASSAAERSVKDSASPELPSA